MKKLVVVAGLVVLGLGVLGCKTISVVVPPVVPVITVNTNIPLPVVFVPTNAAAKPVVPAVKK